MIYIRNNYHSGSLNLCQNTIFASFTHVTCYILIFCTLFSNFSLYFRALSVSGDSALTLLLARCAADRCSVLSDLPQETNSDDENTRLEESVGESRDRSGDGREDGDGGEDESKGLGMGSIPSSITGVKKGRSKGQGGCFYWAQAAELLVKSGESACEQLNF